VRFLGHRVPDCAGAGSWASIIVGAGINGLDMARDVAPRGLRVIVLEHRNFALVRESLRERERMIQMAPHLVKPLRLLMPLYTHNRLPAWLIRLGMIAYGVLSFDKCAGGHEVLDTVGAIRRFPGIATKGLGGVPVVFNVAGPWIDRIYRRGAPPQARLGGDTKGSHLIVDPFPGAPNDVVYYESKTDRRLVLVIPWMGRYMIGTTDLRFDEDPDEDRCSQAEMDCPLGGVNQLIPQAGLTARDVLFTFSGVRPLPYAPSVVQAKILRSHVLHDPCTGVAGPGHRRRLQADDISPAGRRCRGRCVPAARPQEPALRHSEAATPRRHCSGDGLRHAQRFCSDAGRCHSAPCAARAWPAWVWACGGRAIWATAARSTGCLSRRWWKAVARNCVPDGGLQCELLPARL
jgi:glycerol-3-phosphate dehydrogenase